MTEIERLREALLPCPFCGGNAREGNSHIWCETCGAAMQADYEKDTAEVGLCARWNRRAALAATPPGAERGEWKLVPVEPTTLMNVEGHRALEAALGHAVHVAAPPAIWRAMLKAAPPSPPASEGRSRMATELAIAIGDGPECPACHERRFDDWWHDWTTRSVCAVLTATLQCHGCGKFFKTERYDDSETHSTMKRRLAKPRTPEGAP